MIECTSNSVFMCGVKHTEVGCHGIESSGGVAPQDYILFHAYFYHQKQICDRPLLNKPRNERRIDSVTDPVENYRFVMRQDLKILWRLTQLLLRIHRRYENTKT